MHRKLNNILVTGGCGFIGTNFIRTTFADPTFTGRIVNVDALTYAGNLARVRGFEKTHPARYAFYHNSINNFNALVDIIKKRNIDTIINFAAETHVDNSISSPGQFIKTNIEGTFQLLEAARTAWEDTTGNLFHHVSTDEVYGSLGENGYFFETTAYDPRSPYAASKASADHLVKSYHHTYGLPVTISNCSNNYGPYQHHEKLIPKTIINILFDKPIPVYGSGKNVRDWLYVEDHVYAIWRILKEGAPGESYNIGGETEWENIKLVNTLCGLVAECKGKHKDYYKHLITFVDDRLGHDFRYAVNCNKIKKELGFASGWNFLSGLKATVDWYVQNFTGV